MKTLLTIATILLAASALAGPDDWTQIGSPFPERITGIDFVNHDTGYIVTAEGNFGITYDRGKTWASYEFKGEAGFQDIDYVTGTHGYACGSHGVVIVTYDGGTEWLYKGVGIDSVWFTDIIAVNDTVAMACGIHKTDDQPFASFLVRTLDAGMTWQKLDDFGLGMAEFEVGADGTLYLLSFGQINYTSDFGESWDHRLLGMDKPGRALSFNGPNGIVCGPSSMLGYTNDGGATWYTAQIPQNKVLVAAEMLDNGVGYVAGLGGAMFRTNNGGRTWVEETLPRTFDILDLHVDGNRLYVVGSVGAIFYKEIE